MVFIYNFAPNSNYFNTTNNYINTNLFLNLDAGNSSSYSGVGSTWNDLSGNGRNATLINTPTYSGSQGGYFHFTDERFEYAVTPVVPSLSIWTIEAWYRPTKSLTGKITSIVSNEYNGININYSLGNNNAPTTNYNLSGGFYNGSWKTTTGLTPTLNTWYQGLVTYDGSTVTQYSNGIVQSSIAGAGPSVSGGGIRIARRWDGGNLSTNFFDGDISIVRIYSTALSAAQVLQNYNAVKGRYGL
jgi:hypothetical protein